MVWVDGKSIGATPVVSAPVTQGPHEIELQLGTAQIRRSINIAPGQPVRFHWGVDSNDWLALGD
jgi:hypothetical protein